MSDHEEASSSTAQPAAAAAATPAVPYNFPLPAPVKLSGDVYQNFKFFRMQWEDYEVATQLTEKPDSVRMATLRSVMGQNCLQIYQHLHISDADKNKVKPSLDALEKHFQPSTNVVYECYVFGSANQGENETAEQYIARLRHLMATCNYGTLSDELLRDRLVLGTKDTHVRARMFRDPELTLAKAMNMCKVAELSQSQLKQIATTAED